MSVRAAAFGQLPGGGLARVFTLANARGLVAKATDFGATLTELHVPDRTGRPADVVLGFDDLAGYLAPHPYFGSTVGRVANRIARGRFTLGGKDYQLPVNNGPHHLHGGPEGFDKALWRAEPLPGGESGVRFTHVSPDGDQGYPGRLDLDVTMRLTDDDALVIDYRATTDRATPINLTNHAYFNLAGEGDVLGHELWLAATRYTPADETLIPTGEVRLVAGTPLDFTRPTRIGARLDRLPGDPRGYDHNFVIDRAAPGAVLAARVFEPGTGRVMEVVTTQPGMQIYTAHSLDRTLVGKRGEAYGRYAGFCLETQHFPDAVNHPSFPGTILRPGETYRETTIYRFSAR